MESEDRDIFDVADPRAEFEHDIISEIQINTFAEENITEKDREILKLRMDGYTEQEIADKVDYKTASAVHKRIAKITSAYEDFVTSEYSKYLTNKIRRADSSYSSGSCCFFRAEKETQ